MLPKYLLDQAFNNAKELPFLYNHVAGDDRYSPRRGVCVQNNTKKFFDNYYNKEISYICLQIGADVY